MHAKISKRKVRITQEDFAHAKPYTFHWMYKPDPPLFIPYHIVTYLFFACVVVAKENPAQKREPSSANKSKVSISAFEENGSYVDEISQSGQLNKVTVKDDQGSSVEFRQRTQNRRQYRSVRK